MNARVIDPRQPPHNSEAERQLLGGLMMANDVAAVISEQLAPEHFHIAEHRRIYAEITRLAGEGRPANPVTLKGAFAADEKIAGDAPIRYIMGLAADPAARYVIEDYARTIVDLATRRALIGIGEEIMSSAYTAPLHESADDMAATAEQSLMSLRSGTGQETLSGAPDAVVARLSAQMRARMDGKGVPIPKTGLSDFDRDLSFERGDLTVLAGRPAMGKTQVQVAFARRMARKGFNVELFSFEVRAEQIMARLIAAEMAMSHNPLAYGAIYRGELNSEEFAAYERFAEAVSRLPVTIHDRAGQTAAQIEATLRARKAQLERQGKSLDIAFIDHLGLMRMGARYGGNRNMEIGEVTATLKQAARRLDCTILLLSQLNRAVETRDNKRPILADLRESGNIEQDADNVLFLYRPAYYDEKDPKFLAGDPDFMDMAEARKHDLELIIAKNRIGPTRTHTVFLNIAHNDLAEKTDRSRA